MSRFILYPRTVSISIAAFPLEPIAVSGLLAQAREHHAQGQFLEAAEGYRRVLQAKPSSQTALLGLSLIARQSCQFEPALAMAQAALSFALPATTPVPGALSPEQVLAWAHLGHCLFALRRITEAESAFEQAIAFTNPSPCVQNPIAIEGQIQALVGLGELLSTNGFPGKAVARFKAALLLRPALVAAHYGLGNALTLAAGCPAETELALASFQEAARLAPHSAECQFAIGSLHSRFGRHVEAIAAYQSAVKLKPALASAWLNLGVALVAEGRDLLAEACYRQTLAVLPQNSQQYESTRISAYLNLGHLARTRHFFPDAEKYYDRALALAQEENALTARRWPEIFIAFTYLHIDQSNFSTAWRYLGQAEAAETTVPATEAKNIRSPEIPNARGILLLAEEYAQLDTLHPEDRSYKIESAIRAFQAAELLGHQTAASNRGNALLRLGCCAEAVDAHQIALDKDPSHPGVRYNLALTQIRMGDYRNGWRNYEVRWKFREVHPNPRRFSQPRWNGECLVDLNPTSLLIYSEQGLGDTLQFLRYLTLVAERLSRTSEPFPHPARSPIVCTVIFEVQSPLLRLVRPYLVQIEAAAPLLKTKLAAFGDPLPRFTHHCPLLSLPAVFETTVQTIPLPAAGQSGYLNADPDLTDQRCQEIAFAVGGSSTLKLAKIGLAWAGNPNYRADRERSTRLVKFERLLEMQEIQWISLQKGAAAAQINELRQGLSLLDASSGDKDLADTAALIASLDLVITTDTVIAHLAGALGKPFWLLLPWQSDWRWMQDILTSPWYPAARLFRQSSPNNWSELIGRVAEALHEWQLQQTPLHPGCLASEQTYARQGAL